MTGVWSIPKGLVESDDLLACAQREFMEETGLQLKGVHSASPVRQNSGKTVHAFAIEANLDLYRLAATISINRNGRAAPASSRIFPRSTGSPISMSRDRAHQDPALPTSLLDELSAMLGLSDASPRGP